MSMTRIARALSCALALGAAPAWAQKPIAQAVITKEPCVDFSAAKAKAVTKVKDGDPVYLNVQFPNGVEAHLTTWDGSPDSDIYGKKVLYLEIGEAGGGSAWDYAFIWPLADEMNGNFLCVGLAPCRATPVWRGLWLKTVGEGAPGVWRNELRIYDKGDDGSEDRRLVAVAPLTADVGSGIKKYAAQHADYKARFAAGDVAFNAPSPRGKLVDKEAIKAAMSEAAGYMDGKPEGAYFTEPGWYIHRDTWGDLDYHFAMAALFYARDGAYWTRAMEVRKWAGTKRIEAVLQAKELQLSPETYKKAISQSQAK